jgi:hypothetical protein
VAKRRRDRFDRLNVDRRIDGDNGDVDEQQHRRNNRAAGDACAHSGAAIAGTHATASWRDV